jgi:Ankyrin repeats (3 copies)
LKQEQNVNALDYIVGRNALFWAVAADGRNSNNSSSSSSSSSSSVDVVKLLIEYGTDEDTYVDALFKAVRKGNVQHAQVLLTAGASVNAVYILAADSAGEHDDSTEETDSDSSVEAVAHTILMAAETPAMVKLLLAAGADVHVTTDTGNTALHVAVAHGYPAAVLCVLIKAGADLHAVNNDGKTAAQVAADSGNTLAATLLKRAAAQGS